MKQVNFKELVVETNIDKFEKVDLRKDIGNAIHRRALTIPMSDLARQIYHSENSVIMSDEDYAEILTIVQSSFALLVLNAVKNTTEEMTEEGERHD